ncbi:MAG: 4-hydroxy-tetrahydrodipicolinate reductase [Candidatus Omnitrophica bacterium]|nr:4-hydroxy-tetrahydrodipicolinate reductase [Candidatus Omnitrophota bacterium]
MEKINLIVSGAGGRMGSLIIKLAQKDESFFVKGGIEAKKHPLVGKKLDGIEIYDNLEKVLEEKDVLIDFSVPSATMDFIKTVKEKRSKIVIGTTGFSKNQIEEIKKTANYIPIFLSPNMSLGVNLFFEIIKYATHLLKNYEIEIAEVHHHFKKDAPSGTAKKIAEIICNERKLNQGKILKYGRNGITGERKFEEIGVHCLRIGDIVGEHYVYFGGTGEIIEISHRCYDRSVFALGALNTAKYIYKKKNGLYSMEDYIKEEVLNVSSK